jgi:hypothetical protein
MDKNNQLSESEVLWRLSTAIHILRTEPVPIGEIQRAWKRLGTFVASLEPLGHA